MEADTIIRAATPADESSVTELLRAAYSALLRPAYDDDLIAAALPYVGRANPALLRSGTFYVAESAVDGLIGCGGWSAARPGTGERESGLAHLRHFATRPDRARSGVGRAIHARCEEAARSAGMVRLECCASLNAEPFYASLGLKTVGRCDVPMGKILMPCLIMKRDISPVGGIEP